MEHKKFEDLQPEDFKELKIEFAPGCFDHFEGTQEELDGLITEIKKMIVSGEIHENSREITEDNFDDLPREVQEQLANYFLEDETTKRNLQ